MPDRMVTLEQRLGEGRLQRNVALARYTTFRIGGPADYFYRADTVEELVEALSVLRELEIPCYLLGRGANLLVGDGGFRGVVVRCAARGHEFLDATHVRATAGEVIYHDLIEATVAQGLGGLHHFVGIPSSVGGALWQNLHFLSPPPERDHTTYIAEVLESAEILTGEGDVRVVERDYFRFGYDYSILHDRPDVVLRATFRLEPQPEAELRAVMRENLRWRAERHPDLWLYPCAGSVFRKLEGVGAGRLIDACGLKGRIQGNAQIYPKHANIIVNLGGATASDVRILMELAREAVARRFGYELVPEISMVGEFR